MVVSALYLLVIGVCFALGYYLAANFNSTPKPEPSYVAAEIRYPTA